MHRPALHRPPRTAASGAFTLIELLVSMVVLVLLITMVTRIFNMTASLAARANKRMDTDAQARAVLDRMAIDFGCMVKRPDVDYYLKGRPGTNTQTGNDQIAFYSEVAGYYPSSGSKSPVSLVAYRVNTQFVLIGLERLGKGLVWNGVSTTNTPVVFLPIPLASPLPASGSSPTPSALATPAWPQAADAEVDTDYELAGPQVFRFEYYYLLNGQRVVAATPAPSPTPTPSLTLPAILSNVPWDTRAPLNHTGVNGLQDVAAIGVAIAVVDSKSRVLVSDSQLTTLAGKMNDFDPASMTTMGALETQWNAAIVANAAGIIPAALPFVRVYNRCFYLAPRHSDP